MYKKGSAIPGVLAAIAKPCRYAIIPTGKDRQRNRLNSLPKQQGPLLYAVAPKPRPRLIATKSSVKNKIQLLWP